MNISKTMYLVSWNLVEVSNSISSMHFLSPYLFHLSLLFNNKFDLTRVLLFYFICVGF